MLAGVSSTTSHHMFEALFERRLKPEGDFARALRDAGYDPTRYSANYPTLVWTRCLEVTRVHRYAELSIDDAYRCIGREFTEGYLGTLMGRMISVTLPLMTPDSFVRRLNSYLRMARSDESLTFDVTWEGPGRIDARVHNPAAVPGTFVAGLIDAAMSRFGVTWSVEVQQQTPTDYELRVRWT